MNKQKDDFKIIDIFYADCDQSAGTVPRWSTIRTGQQLTDERSLNRLRKQLQELRRKRKLEYAFGDELIEVEHPRNASVRTILQCMSDLPADDHQALGELQQYGDVLARKYLKTQYSRTRLFMVARVMLKGEMRIYVLVTHLNPEFAGECIQPESLDFTSQTIPNLIMELKKGAIYPAVRDNQRNENAISIYDSGHTKYYPESLECVPRQAPEMEAKSFFGVLAEACALDRRQLDDLLRDLRAIERPSFGSDQLVQVLERTGVEVDPERVGQEWRRNFYYSQYEIPPTVLSLESVIITVKLDEFEIKCPLNYYPDRIEHEERGGYHYLRIRGRDYREVQAGSSHIHFAPRGD
jgi:hypothetical protein